MSKELGKLRGKWLSKRDLGFDNLGNSQSIEIAKDIKLRDSFSERCALERKSRVWLCLLVLQRLDV